MWVLPRGLQQLHWQALSMFADAEAHICRKAQAASRLELLASEAELMRLCLQQPAMVRSQQKKQQVHSSMGADTTT